MQASVSSVFNRVLGLSLESYKVTLEFGITDPAFITHVSGSGAHLTGACQTRNPAAILSCVKAETPALVTQGLSAQLVSHANFDVGSSTPVPATKPKISALSQPTITNTIGSQGNPKLTHAQVPVDLDSRANGSIKNTCTHTLTFCWAGNESESSVVQRFLQSKASYLQLASVERVLLNTHTCYGPCNDSEQTSSSTTIDTTTALSNEYETQGANSADCSNTTPTASSSSSTNTPDNHNPSYSETYPVANSQTLQDVKYPTHTPHTPPCQPQVEHLHVQLSVSRPQLFLRSLTFTRASGSGSVSYSTVTSLLRHCDLTSVTHAYFHEGFGSMFSRGVDLTLWTSLTHLHLEACGLTQLPDLRGLTRLQELHVPANKLAMLGEVSRLTQLRVLEANNNMLTGLPVEMRCLRQLRQLHLVNNRLTNLTQHFSSFPNLQSLDLHSNTLMTQLPDLRNGACPELTLLGFSNFIVCSTTPTYDDCQLELLGPTVPHTTREVQLGPFLRQVAGQGAGIHPLLAGALVGLSRDLGDAGVMAANEGVVQQLMDMAMSVDPIVVQQANKVIDVIARNPEVTRKLSRSNLSGLRTILVLSTGPEHPLRSRFPTKSHRHLKHGEPQSRSLPTELPGHVLPPSSPLAISNSTPLPVPFPAAGRTHQPAGSLLSNTPLGSSNHSSAPVSMSTSAGSSHGLTSSAASDPVPASVTMRGLPPSAASSFGTSTPPGWGSPGQVASSSRSSYSLTGASPAGSPLSENILARSLQSGSIFPAASQSGLEPSRQSLTVGLLGGFEASWLGQPRWNQPRPIKSASLDPTRFDAALSLTDNAVSPLTEEIGSNLVNTRTGMDRHAGDRHKADFSSFDRPPLPPIATRPSPLRSASAPQDALAGGSSTDPSPATTPPHWDLAGRSRGSRVRRLSQEPFKSQVRVQQARHRAACCMEMVGAYGAAMEATMQTVGAEGTALTACNAVAAEKFDEFAHVAKALVEFTGELHRKEKKLRSSMSLLEAVDSKLAQLEGTLDRIDSSSQTLARQLGIREESESYVSHLTNPSSYSLTNLRNLVPMAGLGTSPSK